MTIAMFGGATAEGGRRERERGVADEGGGSVQELGSGLRSDQGRRREEDPTVLYV